MPEFINQIYHSITLNLTVLEVTILACAALVIGSIHHRIPWSPTGYSVFLILYITLLRRAPEYKESLLLPLQLHPNLGIWVGNLLNLFLYVPFGWAAERWKRASRAVILTGLCLSVFCETMQYLTARGQADVNDILFNTLGAALGVWLARRMLGDCK